MLGYTVCGILHARDYKDYIQNTCGLEISLSNERKERKKTAFRVESIVLSFALLIIIRIFFMSCFVGKPLN